MMRFSFIVLTLLSLTACSISSNDKDAHVIAEKVSNILDQMIHMAMAWAVIWTIVDSLLVVLVGMRRFKWQALNQMMMMILVDMVVVKNLDLGNKNHCL